MRTGEDSDALVVPGAPRIGGVGRSGSCSRVCHGGLLGIEIADEVGVVFETILGETLAAAVVVKRPQEGRKSSLRRIVIGPVPSEHEVRSPKHH